jgi:hypothetical protein
MMAARAFVWPRNSRPLITWLYDTWLWARSRPVGAHKTVRRIVDDRAFLFPKDDPWLRRVRGWLARN